jgi:hypothetical protein
VNEFNNGAKNDLATFLFVAAGQEITFRIAMKPLTQL